MDNKTKDKELKPCPFCGGVVVMNQNVGHILIDGTPYSFITCDRCQMAFTCTDDEDRIRAIWNQRFSKCCC